MINYKSVIYFILAFIVFYIQPVSFGPLKGSILTQLFCFLYFGNKLIKLREIKTDIIGRASLRVALKVLVSPALFLTTGPIIVDFFKFSVFPLFYHYFHSCIKSLREMEKIVYFFSVFILLSSLPYLVGILQPVAEGYKLDIFGDEGTSGFVGLFQNSHSAGVVISLSIINIYYFSFVKRNPIGKRFFNVLVIMIGAYALYKTYVRTGYLTLIIGMAVILVTRFSIKDIWKYFLGGIVAALVMAYVFSKDQTLQNRIEDKYDYSSGNAVKDLGSGRLFFQLAAFDIWSSASVPEMLFGIGVENLTTEMQKRVELKIHTHNGFTDALVKDGLIGLILFVYFLWSIFKVIRSSKNNEYKLLAFASFFSYLFFQIVQGGIISPMIEIMIVFNLSLLYLASHHTNHETRRS